MTPLQFRRHLASPLPEYNWAIDDEAPLDRWISYAVKVLRDAGVGTYESCQGGPGHSFPEPTIRFHGPAGEGYRAVAVAMAYRLPVFAMRRFWLVMDGELEGPDWEITFRATALKQVQVGAEKSGLMGAISKKGPGK
jgi:hypothetical protein